MTEIDAASTSPITHEINVSTLPQKGRTIHIAADADQLQALAKAHDLLAVESFQAAIDVRRWRRDGVRLVGTIKAAVTQQCVVSLQPVPAMVETSIEATFVPDDSPLARRKQSAAADIVIDPEGPDAPESFAPPMLDIGAAAEEFFDLALDPYPKGPQAAETIAEEGAEEADDKPNPFAALKALRTKPAR